MSYEFVKLSEVEVVEGADEPKVLIEDGGDIKRLPAELLATPQVKADWSEEDPNSPAFILNKPEGGGGGEVVVFTNNSGSLSVNGLPVYAKDVVDAWNRGAILRVEISPMEYGQVVHVSYGTDSGSSEPAYASLTYCDGSDLQTISC